MRIYKVERADMNGYDEYDSFVVVAEDEADAIRFHPGGEDLGESATNPNGTWPVDLSKLGVTLIGEAAPGIERGVVLASFNAG